MIKILKERWPHLFGVGDQPLALGSSEQIAEALETDFNEVRRALAKHCGSIPYLAAIAAGRCRMSITGDISDASEAHIAAAAKLVEIKRFNKKYPKGAKRKAARAQLAFDALKPPPAPPPAVTVVIKKRRMVVVE